MLDAGRFLFFTLVFMRISGFILFNPIFGRRNVPGIVKAGFIMVLTVVVATFSGGVVPEPTLPLEYGILLLKEVAIGYILGFVVNLFLYVIVFAGEFMDMQMGMSMAKIYDAQSNASISLSATFYNALFMLLFFVAGGHIALLKVLLTSAEVVPYGTVVFQSGISHAIFELFTQCTLFAIQFAFPVFAAEFLCEMGVGILMKTIPQINVFVVNIQLKVFLGLLLVLILFTPMAEYLQKLLVIMIDSVKDILQLLR